jgi:hypothetical protein
MNTVKCKDPHGHNMYLSKGFPCCQDCGGTNILDAISERQGYSEAEVKELLRQQREKCYEMWQHCPEWPNDTVDERTARTYKFIAEAPEPQLKSSLT